MLLCGGVVWGGGGGGVGCGGGGVGGWGGWVGLYRAVWICKEVEAVIMCASECSMFQ